MTKIIMVCLSFLCLVTCITQLHPKLDVFFEPLPEAQFESFRQFLEQDYAQQLEKAGIAVTDAIVRQEIDHMLPQGYKTLHNYFYIIKDSLSNNAIGKLWWLLETEDPKCAPNGFIALIWLDPHYRGMGYGKKALTYLEQLHTHIKCIKLHVFKHNQPAINTYLKSGYTITNSTASGYFMQKNLTDHKIN